MRISGKDLNQIEEFWIEKDKFYLILKIATSPDAMILSDLENYIIARSDVSYPTWI